MPARDHVILSYRSLERRYIDPFLPRLQLMVEELGLGLYMDGDSPKRNSLAGAVTWFEMEERAVANIFFLSPHYMCSPACLRELSHGLNSRLIFGTPFFMFMVEDVDHPVNRLNFARTKDKDIAILRSLQKRAGLPEFADYAVRGIKARLLRRPRIDSTLRDLPLNEVIPLVSAHPEVLKAKADSARVASIMKEVSNCDALMRLTSARDLMKLTLEAGGYRVVAI